LPGSAGAATVNGPGSTWNSSGRLYVGCSGSGTLIITNGGSVSSNSNSYSYIGFGPGYNNGATGTVTVDGAGSTWTSALSRKP
jgi:T5SS/PEP-CTERM-associated repeat protein